MNKLAYCKEINEQAKGLQLAAEMAERVLVALKEEAEKIQAMDTDCLTPEPGEDEPEDAPWFASETEYLQENCTALIEKIKGMATEFDTLKDTISKYGNYLAKAENK